MTTLGIDIGTSGTKTLLLSPAGKILATAEAPHPTLTPKPGWSEQRPADWWASTTAATHALLKKVGNPAARSISAIGLSGQMHGTVFLNREGKPLRPALLWNDQRTATQCAQIEKIAGGREKLVKMVQNPALTGFSAPKILWFLQNEPKKFEKCKKILLPKDYLRFLLTGQYASDVSDASGTLLLNVTSRTWHTAFITSLGLDPNLLPQLHESQQVTGTLTPAAAKHLGLPPNIPVVAGAGDQAAGAVGTGVVLPGLVSAAMGTSGVIFATADRPQTDPTGRVHTMCHAIPNTWCVFGCMLSAGGSFQYLRNTLFADQLKKRKDPGDLYPQMIAEAATAPAGSEDLFFLPYLTGERCPHPDPLARAAFIGLTPRHTRAHLLRAALEGITYGMREQTTILRDMGIPITQIRASGGGARSDFWRQLQADMYQAPVVTINVAEGAALGAAILAAVGTGAYGSVPEACSEIIRVRGTSLPKRKVAALYAEKYRRYGALYPALKEFFAQS